MQLSPTRPVSEPKYKTSHAAFYLHKDLKLEHFFESDDELTSKSRMYKEAFAYFIQKLTIQNSDPVQVLKSLREYILPTVAQLSDHDPSLIYYMEVLDENADSQETMAEVSELVIEKMLSNSQKWVVLVGDGKTHEHLQKVKRLYGSAFSKYYHAGLKEIAGYKAETLKSLENCSHFKRTHSFLLQVWEAMFTEMISSFVIPTI